MGSRMAANFLKAGQSLIVHDLNQSAVKSLQSQGASIATTLDDLALKADVIITMLPATQHVKKVIEGTLIQKAR